MGVCKVPKREKDEIFWQERDMRETKKKIKYGGLMIALSKDVILPKTLSEVNELKASQISKFLRSKGLNIIPIVSGTKTPKAGFNLELYFEKMCDAPIKDTDSIALVHGNVSDTLCVDCDVKSENYEDALRLFAKKENTEKFLSKNMVVKTPKKGIHIIVRLKDGKYPRNITYNGPDGNHIDLRSQRAYSLLPPSKYLTKEQHLGNYKFLSSCREPREISLAELETKLAQAKFFPPRDSNNKDIVSGYDLIL